MGCKRIFFFMNSIKGLLSLPVTITDNSPFHWRNQSRFTSGTCLVGESFVYFSSHIWKDNNGINSKRKKLSPGPPAVAN